MKSSTNPLDEMIFVGFNKRVAAVHRDSGKILWDWKASKGSGFVSLLLDGDLLIASISGYTFGLDAISGKQLWYQPFDGFGTGTTSLVSVRGSSNAAAVADIIAQQQAAAASAG
jgi:outer membrane protein assembly factor BamB